MMNRSLSIVAIFAAVVLGGLSPSVGRAEYIRVEFGAGESSRLPDSWDVLIRRVEGGPHQPYSTQVPTFSSALHQNHGGQVGSVSFSDSQDYCDVYWYELPNAQVAQSFLAEYMLSYSSYAPASMPFGERNGNIVIVVVSGVYGAMYQQIVQTITGAR